MKKNIKYDVNIDLANETKKAMAKALDKLERKYGSKFYKMFKSITFDNGVEFMGYKGLEKSCLRKKKRTTIYYAHPYCSGERGTNENNNRLIRRWIPKGSSMKLVPQIYLDDICFDINTMPRKIFDFKSTFDIELNYK